MPYRANKSILKSSPTACPILWGVGQILYSSIDNTAALVSESMNIEFLRSPAYDKSILIIYLFDELNYRII